MSPQCSCLNSVPSSHPLISVTSLSVFPFFSQPVCPSPLCTHTHRPTMHMHTQALTREMSRRHICMHCFTYMHTRLWVFLVPPFDKVIKGIYKMLYISTILQPRQVWGQSSPWGPTHSNLCYWEWHQVTVFLSGNHGEGSHSPPVVCNRTAPLSMTDCYPEAMLEWKGWGTKQLKACYLDDVCVQREDGRPLITMQDLFNCSLDRRDPFSYK